MKKIITLLTAIALIICAFPLTVGAEDDIITLSVSGEKVSAGDEFPVTLFISDNSEMSGAVIDISYDKSQLEFVSAKEGALLNSSANKSIRNIDGEKPYVRFTYLDAASSLTAAGTLMTVYFRALDNAQGETRLTISIPHPKDFVDDDIEPIPYKAVNGVVEITNTTYRPEGPTTGTAGESVTDDNTSTSAPTVPDESESTVNAASNNGKNMKITPIIAFSAAGVIIIGIAVFFIIRGYLKKKR